jgi:hypothetical protein
MSPCNDNQTAQQGGDLPERWDIILFNIRAPAWRIQAGAGSS